jgi:hypothetical protein
MNLFSNGRVVVIPLALVLLLFPRFAGGVTSSLDIQLVSEPDFSRAVPDVNPVRLLLRVRGEDGRPVQNVAINARLESPRKSILISTDFPVVEGTSLWDFTTVSPDGEMELAYIFPIRGTYRLQVTAKPLSNSNPAPLVSRIFQFHIPENPKKVWNLRFLLGGLFGFGMVSGLVLFKSFHRRRGTE